MPCALIPSQLCEQVQSSLTLTQVCKGQRLIACGVWGQHSQTQTRLSAAQQVDTLLLNLHGDTHMHTQVHTCMLSHAQTRLQPCTMHPINHTMTMCFVIL